MNLLKRFSLFFTISVFMGLVGGIGSVLWWRGSIKAPSKDSTFKRFIIEKGSSSDEIGKNLRKAGLIKSVFAYKIYLQSKGLTKKIPPGEYRIAGNLNLAEVVSLLLKGPTEFWVTIPEGLRREEVVERVINQLEFEGVEADKFRLEFLSVSNGLEGFLFPDTYLFPKDVLASTVVSKMKTTFDQKFGTDTGSSGLTLTELVTLASIIERETLTSEEKPIVAGIYLKRLNAGWSLDADATVQFAEANERCKQNISGCDWWKRPLTASDLKIKSAYNTYRNVGLPPGPISNPGLSSLRAVANFQNSPYWFYLHDNHGGIHYAKTLEEHNKNINRYLR